MGPLDRMEYDRILAAVRAQLDDATFDVALAQGRMMTLDQAIEHTLENLKSIGGASDVAC